jgi:hypothetical protein
VAGYGIAGVVGVKAIAATVLKMTRLPHAGRNAHVVPHISSLIYRLVDPHRLTGTPSISVGVDCVGGAETKHRA